MGVRLFLELPHLLHAIYNLGKQKPFGYTFPYCLQVNCSKQQYVYNWRLRHWFLWINATVSTIEMRKYFIWVLYCIEMIKVYALNSHATRCSWQNKYTVYRTMIFKEILFNIRGTFHALWKPLWDWKTEWRAPNKTDGGVQRENQPRETSWILLIRIQLGWVEWASGLSGNANCLLERRYLLHAAFDNRSSCSALL